MNKIQILLFYIALIILSIGVAWRFSNNEDKMGNSLGLASIALGISALLWQNYGRHMSSY